MAQRLPARVYWVRRILLLVVLAVLVVLVVLVIRALLGSGRQPTATSSPSVSTSAAPAPTFSGPTYPGGITECDPAALNLVIAPSATTFAAEINPTFTVTITNTGSTACLVDAGDTHREIVVTSGEDRIWSSQDCAPGDADDRTLLLSPQKSDAQQLAWNRIRSAPGCPADLPVPGPGTYVASFTVGGASATPVSFALD